MRKPLVLGNWKMHGSQAFALALAEGVRARSEDLAGVEVGLCPPFVALPVVARALAGSKVAHGAQNVSEYSEGAYTGEISAAMLADLECTYVLVGHSERRQLFAEQAGQVVDKLVRAHAAGLTPVLCVGETLAERQAGTTDAVIAAQLRPLLERPDAAPLLARTVIAYEPVWAIGTGVTASPEQAQAVHAALRRQLAAVAAEAAAAMRLLYGGSVKADNAAALFAMPDIDGGLIGGAALKVEDFCAIAAAAALTRS